MRCTLSLTAAAEVNRLLNGLHLLVKLSCGGPCTTRDRQSIRRTVLNLPLPPLNLNICVACPLGPLPHFPIYAHCRWLYGEARPHALYAAIALVAGTVPSRASDLTAVDVIGGRVPCPPQSRMDRPSLGPLNFRK